MAVTDRAQGFLVYLDDDYRLGDTSDFESVEGGKVLAPTDADAIAHAIRMVKGVVKVEPIPVDFNDRLARERAVVELRTKLWEVLR